MKELSCCNCNKLYPVNDCAYRAKLSALQKRGIRHFCSKECRYDARNLLAPQEVECLSCSKKFIKNGAAIKRYPKHFCSTSCSATYNNKTPGRKFRERTSLRKCKFIECNEMLFSSRDGNRSYCSSCIKQKRHIQTQYTTKNIDDITIDDVVRRAGANRYDVIRSRAHALYKQEKLQACCKVCAYDKHVELCHIKPISQFPKDTKISTVNDRSNIMFLCPNCHWEHDNNLR